MALVALHIDLNTARIVIRRPNGNDELTINANPDFIYWVRINGGILQGRNADGLAKVLGELGEIDRKRLRRIADEISAIDQLSFDDKEIEARFFDDPPVYAVRDIGETSPEDFIDLDQLANRLVAGWRS
ncbi:hypothetical protein [Phyllobacterium sophorae]|uniref:hypothetical protein n=1 Tax=Phyllobacterium sophorae TaxID=1520277 RepID=UPI0011B26FB8|nr:hypothetical protein [Phyllobacterium sophorae]